MNNYFSPDIYYLRKLNRKTENKEGREINESYGYSPPY